MQPQYATVPDFRKQPFGCLVVHSPHYNKENGYRPKGSPKIRFGIVTDLSFYEDADGHAIPWPWVHWEGETRVSLCHPLNVVPYRDKQFVNMTMNLEMKERPVEDTKTSDSLSVHLL